MIAGVLLLFSAVASTFLGEAYRRFGDGSLSPISRTVFVVLVPGGWLAGLLSLYIFIASEGWLYGLVFWCGSTTAAICVAKILNGWAEAIMSIAGMCCLVAGGWLFLNG